jgi:hypothetical protein
MSERIIVPIAIRDDTEARLQIPVDLTHAEAFDPFTHVGG